MRCKTCKWQIAGKEAQNFVQRTCSHSEGFVRCELAGRFESNQQKNVMRNRTVRYMHFKMSVEIMFVEKNSRCMVSFNKLYNVNLCSLQTFCTITGMTCTRVSTDYRHRLTENVDSCRKRNKIDFLKNQFQQQTLQMDQMTHELAFFLEKKKRSQTVWERAAALP